MLYELRLEIERCDSFLANVDLIRLRIKNPHRRCIGSQIGLRIAIIGNRFTDGVDHFGAQIGLGQRPQGLPQVSLPIQLPAPDLPLRPRR